MTCSSSGSHPGTALHLRIEDTIPQGLKPNPLFDQCPCGVGVIRNTDRGQTLH